MLTNSTDQTLPKPVGIPSNSPKCPPIDCKVDPLMLPLRGHKGVAWIPESPESDYAESALQGESSLDEMFESARYPGISKAPAFGETLYESSPEDPSRSPSEEPEGSSEMFSPTSSYHGIDGAPPFDKSPFNISLDDSAYDLLEQLEILLAQSHSAN
ncbi:unnamed protein product [Rhizoctonia solani]|uniref:Uncharacterized protein n=1 Tax=Rhizoctonia solani TaxID=456999 RepID=A0A8H2X271_9AGAM|nr:unnamed protein product [Rhizoctonia solani]